MAKIYEPLPKSGIVPTYIKDVKPDMTTYKVEIPFNKTQTKNQKKGAKEINVEGPSGLKG